MKIFCAISANEKWEVFASDVRAAFLQSDSLDRDVFVEPPPQRKKEGIIWKLKKPAYGLRDASRKWFHSTENTLFSLKMQQSKRDSCLFYFLKDNNLEGLLIFHVDDFLSSGTKVFEEEVMKPLQEKYSFGKPYQEILLIQEYISSRMTQWKYSLIRTVL